MSEKQGVPPGRYVCPNCKASMYAHIPLSVAPTHRCSALKDIDESSKSKKTYVMERQGEAREGRNRLRGLDTPA